MQPKSDEGSHSVTLGGLIHGLLIFSKPLQINPFTPQQLERALIVDRPSDFLVDLHIALVKCASKEKRPGPITRDTWLKIAQRRVRAQRQLGLFDPDYREFVPEDLHNLVEAANSTTGGQPSQEDGEEGEEGEGDEESNMSSGSSMDDGVLDVDSDCEKDASFQVSDAVPHSNKVDKNKKGGKSGGGGKGRKKRSGDDDETSSSEDAPESAPSEPQQQQRGSKRTKSAYDDGDSDFSLRHFKAANKKKKVAPKKPTPVQTPVAPTPPPIQGINGPIEIGPDYFVRETRSATAKLLSVIGGGEPTQQPNKDKQKQQQQQQQRASTGSAKTATKKRRQQDDVLKCKTYEQLSLAGRIVLLDHLLNWCVEDAPVFGQYLAVQNFDEDFADRARIDPSGSGADSLGNTYHTLGSCYRAFLGAGQTDPKAPAAVTAAVAGQPGSTATTWDEETFVCRVYRHGPEPNLPLEHFFPPPLSSEVSTSPQPGDSTTTIAAVAQPAGSDSTTQPETQPPAQPSSSAQSPDPTVLSPLASDPATTPTPMLTDENSQETVITTPTTTTTSPQPPSESELVVKQENEDSRKATRSSARVAMKKSQKEVDDKKRRESTGSNKGGNKSKSKGGKSKRDSRASDVSLGEQEKEKQVLSESSEEIESDGAQRELEAEIQMRVRMDQLYVAMQARHSCRQFSVVSSNVAELQTFCRDSKSEAGIAPFITELESTVIPHILTLREEKSKAEERKSRRAVRLGQTHDLILGGIGSRSMRQRKPNVFYDFDNQPSDVEEEEEEEQPVTTPSETSPSAKPQKQTAKQSQPKRSNSKQRKAVEETVSPPPRAVNLSQPTNEEEVFVEEEEGEGGEELAVPQEQPLPAKRATRGRSVKRQQDSDVYEYQQTESAMEETTPENFVSGDFEQQQQMNESFESQQGQQDQTAPVSRRKAVKYGESSDEFEAPDDDSADSDFVQGAAAASQKSTRGGRGARGGKGVGVSVNRGGSASGAGANRGRGKATRAPTAMFVGRGGRGGGGGASTATTTTRATAGGRNVPQRSAAAKSGKRKSRGSVSSDEEDEFIDSDFEDEDEDFSRAPARPATRGTRSRPAAAAPQKKTQPPPPPPAARLPRGASAAYGAYHQAPIQEEEEEEETGFEMENEHQQQQHYYQPQHQAASLIRPEPHHFARPLSSQPQPQQFARPAPMFDRQRQDLPSGMGNRALPQQQPRFAPPHIQQQNEPSPSRPYFSQPQQQGGPMNFPFNPSAYGQQNTMQSQPPRGLPMQQQQRQMPSPSDLLQYRQTGPSGFQPQQQPQSHGGVPPPPFGLYRPAPPTASPGAESRFPPPPGMAGQPGQGRLPSISQMNVQSPQGQQGYFY